MKYTTLLKNASVEKDVEVSYKQVFAKHWLDADISSPYLTDGMIKKGDVRLLAEFKLNKNLKVRAEAMKVLAQAVYYIKRFQEAGEPLPNVIFVGDVDECFIVDAKRVVKHLSMDIDWTAAPSSSHPELEAALINDYDIAPFVYDVHAKLDFADVIEKIEAIARGESPKNKATIENLEKLYGIWESRIFKGKLDAKEKVAAFMKSLFYPEDCYLHPKKANVLVVNRGAGIKVGIDAHAYRAFLGNFHQGYPPSTIDELYGIQDRILEETTRRMQGEFYTPRVWVDYAHKMLAEELGSDWKETHLVIDCAAGIANLTQGYTFANLILSTLNEEDVDVIKEQDYNTGAIVEKWDFLRGGIPKSIDEKLQWAAKHDIPVVWFSNPPYGTACNAGTGVTHKAGIALTSVNERMKTAQMGASATQQLYTQFMFQIAEITGDYGLRSILAFYTKPNFMTGSGYGKFGNFWQWQWKMEDGILIPAGDFTGTSQLWGISFTIWRLK